PLAFGSNGNWTNLVTLIPGTNLLSAYAVDTTGNVSATTTVKLIYILTDTLTVQIIGSGTLSPNDNNVKLVIGNTYSMKATAAKGFTFGFWSGGVPMTTSATLSFKMVPDLSITANFKDATAPSISITTPIANERYSNTTINVSGKASDNVGVLEVGVQINGTGWVTATGTNSWFVNELPGRSGTNILQAYALDAAGNLTTNTVKFKGILPPDWAPDALTYSTIEINPGSGVTATFGTTNFNQTDTNTLGDSGVGSYVYLKDSTNTAELQLAFTNPPSLVTTQAIQLTFTNLNTGIYTNTNSAEVGTFSVVTATNTLPASWV